MRAPNLGSRAWRRGGLAAASWRRGTAAEPWRRRSGAAGVDGEKQAAGSRWSKEMAGTDGEEQRRERAAAVGGCGLVRVRKRRETCG